MIASVHTSFGMGEQAMTDRMVAAIEHPLVDAIGHPTGRKIESRAPYAVDVSRLIEAAARTGTMLEINAAPDRRDLDEVHARAAAEAGVTILIDSDAHSVRNLELMRYGVVDRAASLALAGAGGQHEAVGGVRGVAQARAVAVCRRRSRSRHRTAWLGTAGGCVTLP